jgi:hypothetical protein
VSPPDEEAFVELLAEYGLQMDVGTVPLLAERYSLVVDPADAQLTPGV